jgi:ABC-type amino acid transport system permease subunit
MYIYDSIPYFLAAMVVVIVTISVILWRRGKQEDSGLRENDHHSSTWLLVGLLFVSIFALGAFVMYALLSYVS